MTSGEKLKKDLKLSNIQNVRLCRLIGTPIHTYIIYFNSRLPNYPITQTTVNNLDNYIMFNKGSNIELGRELTLTPIIDIEDFNGNVNSSYFIVVDLIGRIFQSSSMFKESTVETYNVFTYFNSKLTEALYFKDLVKSAGMSDFTAKFRKERDKVMGRENRLAKLVECNLDKADNSVTFRFLTPATEKYSDKHVFKTVDPITKELVANPSKLYTIDWKVLKFFDWINTTPLDYPITRTDLNELFDIAEIQIWSDSPSFHYQSMNYNLSLIGGSMYPTDIAPKVWNSKHGEYAFTDKHITGILNNQSFYFNQMASMLTKRLKEIGYFTKNIK